MPQDNIEEIKQKIDIVDLVREYIQLKPAGTNNYKANCPFHHEKTPSFMVSKDKQIWHCFGCGEGGDIFTFVQKMEGMEFPEALRVLAKKAGVRLQYQDPAISNQKTKLMDICKDAASFFYRVLLEHPKAEFVRDYLAKRKVSGETIDRWLLGYAPEAWDALNVFLKKKGYAEEDIFQAGLTVKKERGSGYNDRFRNRLMFPISDIHGNIVGFGGRWLGKENKNVGKYINSPQTLIYNKSLVLFGLDKAKQAIKSSKQAVIVEGYMDCISSHQSGVTNVVAASGTALTPEQVKLLKRYTDNLSFAFDQDIAGNSAAKRGIEVAWQQEMNTKIIQLPKGVKDPDDLIKANPAAWPEVIKAAQSIMDYYFETTLAPVDLSRVEDKKEVVKVLLPVIYKLADSVEQSHYVQKLAAAIKVNESVLWDKLKSFPRSESKKLDPSGRTAAPLPKKDRFEKLAESVIGLALWLPEQLSLVLERLKPEYVSGWRLNELYKKITIYYTREHQFNFDSFISFIRRDNQHLESYANVLVMKAQGEFSQLDRAEIEKELAMGINDLAKNWIKSELRKTEEKIKQAELSGQKEDLKELTELFSKLTRDLKNFD